MDDGWMMDGGWIMTGWKGHGTNGPLPTPYGCQSIPCRGGHSLRTET